ncbi:MAG: WD40 repeat domain-containing protein, partial [Myxococcota bacterium]
MTITRHTGPVTSVASRPGTSEVVSGAYDSGVGIFDTHTQTFQLLGYHEHLTNRVVVSPDGHLAASCSSDYSVRLWDLRTRTLLKVLQGHADDVEDFVFVGSHVGVSASRDRRILVWDLRTGAITAVFDDHDKDVLSLAYHQGRLFSSGDDKTLRVWNLAEGTLEKTIGPFEVETDTCDIDPVRGRIVLGCDDGIVRIFNAASGELVHEIHGHTSGIKKVAVSEQGHILSAAYDQKIIIWDRDTFAQKQALQSVKHKWERSFAFADGGANVIAGTFDGTLLKWNATSGTLIDEFG